MATPQVKDLVLRSPAGSSEVLTFLWPLQVGTGQDRHDNGIDIIDTIKFVCDELPSISSAFEEINLNHIDTACYKTMINLVERFNKAVDSIVALEKGTSLPAERLNKFAHPSLLRHILQLVYNAAVLDPDKLNNYEPFSPEVYGETSYELVQQMIKHVNVTNDDTFIDLGSGVGQVVLQMAGSFPLKSCVGVEKADTPARYAERMDIFFRQFMAWFGKRYCEYKLLKGDFLVDEHREKITSSSLVFVNNFAFGPNVDHQLKERFADLRDGARVVSSKSFCPLNFRITDRNLSDIGTIMHVSEIPPLKGSVSWTCKPVSYYLHVIDRTILERYFQRLKTQKGAENDHAGSNTRTTRDRAKREANNQASTNSQNSNSNSNTTRTNSPAAHVNSTSISKTRQQQQQQQQQQRNMEIETSTESDGDANTTNGNSNCSGGPPATRKVWSDWGSSKGGKSSQSDEEENNNFITTTVRTARTTTQKKRKKLTRKAAIANKSAAAAAQREAAAKERAEAAQASKDNSSKEDFGGNSTGGGSAVAKGRKGRLKKGARGRKSLKIAGLDVLHQETLLSTSLEVMSKKLPPAPGTIDQQLTSLLTENMDHAELEIPEAPQDTPYALQILLDVFRSQYMAMIDQMKSNSFIPNIKRQIQLEQERKQRIKNRASQLDKQIKVLIDDSVALLKVRMNELGINVSSPNDLIAKAKEIVGRHKELQGVAKKIQSQVTACELEQKRLLKKHLQYLPEYQRLCGVNGKTKLHDLSGCELSEASAHELVLKEIANTLTQRKKLVAQVSNIEKEANTLEKSVEERRTAAALLAQGTNIILTNPIAPTTNNNNISNQPLQLTTTNHNHLNALTINSATSSSSSCSLTINPANNINSTTSLVPNTNINNSATQQPSITVTKTSSKSVRRSRDNRTRSQEWPDVPDVGKIEESNPEVLAQKILETGRKIEAGKLTSNSNTNSSSKHHNQNIVNNHHHQHQQQLQHHHHLINQNHHHIQQHLPQHHPDDKPYRNKHQQSNHAHQQHHQPHHQRSNSNEHLSSLGGYGGGVQQDPSALMPAPKQRDGNLLNVATSIRPINNSNALNSSILPKCEMPGLRKPNNNNVPIVNIQESPKVANFEDRLKSIITSALNEDQEQRKAQQVVNQVQVEVSPAPQQSAVPKRSKHSHISAANSNLHAASSNTHNSLSSIINVATHGMTHLNATTTISPITPALPPPQPPPPTHGSNAPGSISKYASNKAMILQPLNSSMSSSQTVNSSSAKSSKYHQPHNPNLPNSHGQHNQHINNIYGTGEHNLHRRRSSVSAANYEQFVANQQREREREREREHQLQQQQQQHMMNMGQHNPHNLSLEFKQPSINIESHIVQQRSSSREMLMDDPVPPVRSSSANSDSALQYYPPTRDRLMSMERSSSSRESAISQHHTAAHLINPQQQPPSRPSSNSSQPDYTQVSPAKMALRRHLSQEKLNQVIPGSAGSAGNSLPPMSSSKTIGDLVNGEIERTLEITHQSIINAAVNMSTVGSAAGERNPFLLERSIYNTDRDRERSNDREREREREREKERERERDLLIINNHAQRPERVHVKVTDDLANTVNNYTDISPRSTSQSAHSGRKSPYAHNLATLANVAYQHKTIPPANATTNNHHHQQQQLNSSSSASALRHFNTSSNSNTSQRDRDLNNTISSYHLASTAATNKNSLANPNSNPVSSSATNRDYQPVALPRAEMKPCIEAYFHEQDHHQSQPQQHLVSSHSHKSGKERHSSRNNRLNGTNPPLEGLAASLMASRKFREEHEERQKRAAAASNASGHHNGDHHAAAHAQNHQQNRQHHNIEHYNNSYGQQQAASTLHNSHHNGSPMKVELGVKRTSPMTNNYPRGAKVAHFSKDSPLPLGSSGHSQNPYGTINGGEINSTNTHHHHGHHNTPISKNPDPAACASRRGNKLSMEPLIMSPEINSMISGDDARTSQQHASVNSRQSSMHNNSNSHQHAHGHYNNYHHQQQLQAQSHQLNQQHNSHHHHGQHINNRNINNNSTTSSSSSTTAPTALTNPNNIVGNRNADDDDVIADDESHWQHRVSSGFDRLVAFASTELDKTRRSIDADTVPSSISCNTSPDSGITHSSSNSDAARTFLSTSSTSSQLDLPISSGSSTSSGNSSFMSHHSHHHHNHLGGSQEHLSDSSMKSTHSDVNSMAIALKNCSSPQDPTAIDSPPLSDMGLPRTPSPNVAVNTPPPSSLLNASNSLDSTSNHLKIPLKYQRKSKTSLEKHYKKKFCERNWEYDCDELLAYSNSSSNPAADAAGNANDQIDGVNKDMDCLNNTSSSLSTLEQQQQQIHHHQMQQQQQQQQQHQQHHALHKSSKFRPKGKDWDWSMDSNSSSSQKTKGDLSATTANSSVSVASAGPQPQPLQ